MSEYITVTCLPAGRQTVMCIGFFSTKQVTVLHVPSLSAVWKCLEDHKILLTGVYYHRVRISDLNVVKKIMVL